MVHEIIYDHQDATITMEEVKLYDATNYPYTINPKKFFEAVQKGVNIKDSKEFKVKL